jgi:hypothetical protein
VWPFVKQRQVIDLNALRVRSVVRADVVYLPHWEQADDAGPDCPPDTGSAWAVARLHATMMQRLHSRSLPTARNVIVFVVRGGERSRAVVNNDALLSILRARLKPELELVVLTDPKREEGALAAVRAVAMIGPEGGNLMVRAAVTALIGVVGRACVLHHRRCASPLCAGVSLQNAMFMAPDRSSHVVMFYNTLLVHAENRPLSTIEVGGRQYFPYHTPSQVNCSNQTLWIVEAPTFADRATMMTVNETHFVEVLMAIGVVQPSSE